jgi:hypothetical protein
MRFKSIKILLIVFVGLLIVAAAYIAIQRRPTTRKPFAGKEFTRIEIDGRDTLCVFEKKQEKWRMIEPVEYDVDTMALGQLLKGFNELKVNEVVSSREEKHEDFEVGESGVRIKVFWDNSSEELIIGKMAGDFMNWYMRFPPDPETYLSTGLSKFVVQKNSGDWRDKAIFSFDTSAVSELDVDGQKIVRADTVWMKNDKIVETSKINSALGLLSALRADGFGDAEFELDFEVRIALAGDEEKVLHVGKKTDKYPVKTPDNPIVFLLYPWKIDRLKEL